MNHTFIYIHFYPEGQEKKSSRKEKFEYISNLKKEKPIKNEKGEYFMRVISDVDPK